MGFFIDLFRNSHSLPADHSDSDHPARGVAAPELGFWRRHSCRKHPKCHRIAEQLRGSEEHPKQPPQQRVEPVERHASHFRIGQRISRIRNGRKRRRGPLAVRNQQNVGRHMHRIPVVGGECSGIWPIKIQPIGIRFKRRIDGGFFASLIYHYSPKLELKLIMDFNFPPFISDYI